MIDIKGTKEKAKQLHRDGKLGQFACSSDYCMYRLSGEDIIRGCYKCKKCGFENQNVEIKDWASMSKKGLKCEKCKKVVYKPSGFLKKRGRKKKKKEEKEE